MLTAAVPFSSYSASTSPALNAKAAVLRTLTFTSSVPASAAAKGAAVASVAVIVTR